MSHQWSEAARAAWAAVETVNRLWTHREARCLADHLHPEMVLCAPGFAERLQGREACARTYTEFAAHARIETFQASEAEVDVFGDTAVAVYRYRIVYELAGERHDETGHDHYVLVCREGRWWPIWRTLSPGT